MFNKAEKFLTGILKNLAVLFVLLGSVGGAAGQDSPEALIDAEHWKRARALIEPLLHANPGDARANFLMSRCYEAAGDYDRALALAQKAVAIEPKNADYHCMLSYIYGRQVLRAGLLRKIGLARRIRKEAETAVQLNPQHVEARLILIEYYFQAPGIIGGNKAKARALAEEVVKTDPVRGYIAQASIAHREGLTARQEDLTKKAVEANPQSYQALMSLAGFYVYESRGIPTKGSFDIAEKYAREAMNIDPGRIGAYSLLVQIFARQEQSQNLDDILFQAETSVPDNLNPYFQAGRIVYQQGKDFERAERYFRKYLTREPEQSYASRGQAASHAQAYWRLGQTLEKQNRVAEALEAIQTAVKLDPGLENAKRDLRRFR